MRPNRRSICSDTVTFLSPAHDRGPEPRHNPVRQCPLSTGGVAPNADCAVSVDSGAEGARSAWARLLDLDLERLRVLVAPALHLVRQDGSASLGSTGPLPPSFLALNSKLPWQRDAGCAAVGPARRPDTGDIGHDDVGGVVGANPASAVENRGGARVRLTRRHA